MSKSRGRSRTALERNLADLLLSGSLLVDVLRRKTLAATTNDSAKAIPHSRNEYDCKSNERRERATKYSPTRRPDSMVQANTPGGFRR